MDDVISAAAEATAESAGISLELAPLLAAYRRHEHLSVRIERLPARARLSRGSNNGDRTWSLTLDDLQDLRYLPPEGMNAAHTLAIRILSLDGDYGATLAVLDLPVSPFDGPQRALPAEAASGVGDDHDRDGASRRLPQELADAKAALAAREAELGSARQVLEQMQDAARATVDNELAAARARWEGELRERMAEAAAAAASNLETSRAQWQAQMQERLAAVEALAEQRVAEARDRSRQQAEAALSEATAGWQAELAARLAAAEAQTRASTAEALAERQTRLDELNAELANVRAQASVESGELRRFGDELRVMKASLAASETALAETRQRLDQARASASDATKAELAKARAAWDAELATARAQASVEGGELHRLGDELSATRASLAASETALAETRRRLDQARASARDAGGAELAAARAAWDAELRERLARAAAEAGMSLENSRAAWQAEADRRLAEARERWEQEAEAALAKAQEAWREDAARLAGSATPRQDEAERPLAETKARLQSAEAALAEARTRAEGDAIELHFLREELAEVKSSLAQRDAELAEALAAGEEAHRTLAETAHAAKIELGQLHLAERLLTGRARQDDVVSAGGRGGRGEASGARHQPAIGSRLIIGALLAGLAGAIGFFAFSGQAVLDRWWPDAEQAGDDGPPLVRSGEPTARSQALEATDAAARRIVVGVVVAKVRSAPSPSAAVIATLARDTEVMALERRGKWIRVRTKGADGAEAREGWVYGASLKEEPSTP